MLDFPIKNYSQIFRLMVKYSHNKQVVSSIILKIAVIEAKSRWFANHNGLLEIKINDVEILKIIPYLVQLKQWLEKQLLRFFVAFTRTIEQKKTKYVAILFLKGGIKHWGTGRHKLVDRSRTFLN